MKRFRLFTLILLSACIFSAGVAFGGYPDSPRDIVIQMMTSKGIGSDAARLVQVPDFTLYGDGRVIYAKTDNQDIQQLVEAKMDEKQINLLLDLLESEGFFDLNENYMNLTVKDLDTTVITVRTSETVKTVRVYGLLLAARQKMLPKEIVNIYRRLSEFRADGEKPYEPAKISLFVYEFTGNLPKEAKIIKWKVGGVKLPDYAEKEKSLIIRYKETVLQDKIKDDVLKFLQGKTLYGNQAGFYTSFFSNQRNVYKVAFRPHLPYEE